MMSNGALGPCILHNSAYCRHTVDTFYMLSRWARLNAFQRKWHICKFYRIQHRFGIRYRMYALWLPIQTPDAHRKRAGKGHAVKRAKWSENRSCPICRWCACVARRSFRRLIWHTTLLQSKRRHSAVCIHCTLNRKYVDDIRYRTQDMQRCFSDFVRFLPVVIGSSSLIDRSIRSAFTNSVVIPTHNRLSASEPSSRISMEKKCIFIISLSAEFACVQHEKGAFVLLRCFVLLALATLPLLLALSMGP